MADARPLARDSPRSKHSSRSGPTPVETLWVSTPDAVSRAETESASLANTFRYQGTQNRICIDPQLHPMESHASVHHPGLLHLAD
jgi:hypothetical protein